MGVSSGDEVSSVADLTGAAKIAAGSETFIEKVKRRLEKIRTQGPRLLSGPDHALNEGHPQYGEWSNKFEWEIELENVNDGGVRDKGRVARAKGRRRCIMAKFEELDVWKRSARLSAELYKYFHTLKDYGFRDQITRSGLSIPSNIAEGYERDSDKDRSKFLTYSKGSCGELRTQIYIGIEIGYIDKAQGGKWVQETQELSRMLFGLMKYIKGE